MEGIVISLQKELISTDCDVIVALRKAKVIASKLNISDFGLWVEKELNGYSDNNVPAYRKVRGILKAKCYHGYVTVSIGDSQLENRICEQNMKQPISQIMNFINDKDEGSLLLYLSGDVQHILNKCYDIGYPTEFVLRVEQGAMQKIVESVKNKLLDWTLVLEEKGIVGEGLVFSCEEKQAARGLTYPVNNYYGTTNIISGPVENAQLITGNDNDVSIDLSVKYITEVRKAIENEQLSEQDGEKALNLLSEINEKIEQKEKPSKIKAAWNVLKDFLISVGANVAAEFIQSHIM